MNDFPDPNPNVSEGTRRMLQTMAQEHIDLRARLVAVETENEKLREALRQVARWDSTAAQELGPHFSAREFARSALGENT